MSAFHGALPGSEPSRPFLCPGRHGAGHDDCHFASQRRRQSLVAHQRLSRGRSGTPAKPRRRPLQLPQGKLLHSVFEPLPYGNSFCRHSFGAPHFERNPSAPTGSPPHGRLKALDGRAKPHHGRSGPIAAAVGRFRAPQPRAADVRHDCARNQCARRRHPQLRRRT